MPSAQSTHSHAYHSADRASSRVLKFQWSTPARTWQRRDARRASGDSQRGTHVDALRRRCEL
eukprot:IDg15385t1